MAVDCPSPADLDRFQRGELDEAAASRVRAHLETCSACREAVDGNRDAARRVAGDPPEGPGASTTEPFNSRGDAPGPVVMSSLKPDEANDPEPKFAEGEVVFGHY